MKIVTLKKAKSTFLNTFPHFIWRLLLSVNWWMDLIFNNNKGNSILYIARYSYNIKFTYANNREILSWYPPDIKYGFVWSEVTTGYMCLYSMGRVIRTSKFSTKAVKQHSFDWDFLVHHKFRPYSTVHCLQKTENMYTIAQ